MGSCWENPLEKLAAVSKSVLKAGNFACGQENQNSTPRFKFLLSKTWEGSKTNGKKKIQQESQKPQKDRKLTTFSSGQKHQLLPTPKINPPAPPMTHLTDCID